MPLSRKALVNETPSAIKIGTIATVGFITRSCATATRENNSTGAKRRKNDNEVLCACSANLFWSHYRTVCRIVTKSDAIPNGRGCGLASGGKERASTGTKPGRVAGRRIRDEAAERMGRLRIGLQFIGRETVEQMGDTARRDQSADNRDCARGKNPTEDARVQQRER